jgi:hypothetical protein
MSALIVQFDIEQCGNGGFVIIHVETRRYVEYNHWPQAQQSIYGSKTWLRKLWLLQETG